jgi:hypothetical protein
MKKHAKPLQTDKLLQVHWTDGIRCFECLIPAAQSGSKTHAVGELQSRRGCRYHGNTATRCFNHLQSAYVTHMTDVRHVKSLEATASGYDINYSCPHTAMQTKRGDEAQHLLTLLTELPQLRLWITHDQNICIRGCARVRLDDTGLRGLRRTARHGKNAIDRTYGGRRT